MLAIGCESTAHEPQPAPPPAAVRSQPAPDELESDEPKPLGQFTITFYYVIGEDEVVAEAAKPAAANDNARDSADTPRPRSPTGPGHPLRAEGLQADRRRLARVRAAARAPGHRQAARRPGAQHLGPLQVRRTRRASRSPTTSGAPPAPASRSSRSARSRSTPRSSSSARCSTCRCSKAGRCRAGAPWGGYVHDGCVVADDIGGGIDGNQLDLFVGRKAYFLGLSGQRRQPRVGAPRPVFDGSKICERKGRVVTKKSARSSSAAASAALIRSVVLGGRDGGDEADEPGEDEADADAAERLSKPLQLPRMPSCFIRSQSACVFEKYSMPMPAASVPPSTSCAIVRL